MLLANPGYLWLFLLFIPLIAWYIYKRRTLHASMEVSTVSSFARAPRSILASLRHILSLLQLAAIGCVIIVLARPQTRDSWNTSSVEGTDIVLAMDISTSMLARDFKPDRCNLCGGELYSLTNDY